MAKPKTNQRTPAKVTGLPQPAAARDRIPLPEDPDLDPNKPMTPEQAVLFATRLHRLGQLAAAQQVYEAVLKVLPDHAGALQFYGILKHQQGDSAQAIELIRRSIALAGGEAGGHMNLGNVMLETGRFDEAAEAYAQASALMPDNAELINNLAILKKAQGHLDEAEALYRKAIALDEDYFEAHNNLGHLLCSVGRQDEALQHYFKALTLAPHNAGSLRLLGMAYSAVGQMDKAAEVYRDWMAREPDNPAPRHYLAACEQSGVPDRAADDYVRQTFDQFAASFDAKLESLNYQAPALLADALPSLSGLTLGAKALDVLDAGCGTGLCGPLLAPHARSLTGVDLSGEMMRRAEGRQVYDALHEAELGAFIAQHPATWDLIVSADTLCYFGALEGVSRGAFDALRPGGWLLYSVEALPEAQDGQDAATPPFRLQHHGRYSHRGSYVQATLEAAGFTDIAVEPATLRKEAGRPVHGWIARARRPAA